MFFRNKGSGKHVTALLQLVSAQPLWYDEYIGQWEGYSPFGQRSEALAGIYNTELLPPNPSEKSPFGRLKKY